MTVSLWLGTTGRLDRLPVADVLKFEREFIDFVKRTAGGVLDGIRETLKFEDSTEQQLESAYNEFLPQFQTSDGGSIKAGSEQTEALEDGDVEQEQIVKQKRG
jgi:F-type H+-transporting ATPase subunit alpha